MNERRWLVVGLFGLLLGYWAVSLHGLTVVPAVYEDEPWQASTGWKIAQEGVFGSELFRGFYGMESRYYGYMPLHPLLLGGLFRLVGLGLFQARFEAVVMGLLGLAVVARLGRLLVSPAGSLISLFLLLFIRTAGLTPSQYSGIIWLDISRISRYDMMAAVLGLLAYAAYLTACRRLRPGQYFLTGLLVGLAGLAHLYGLFWLPIIGLLTGRDIFWRGSPWSSRFWRLGLPLLFGFSLPWLLYAGYVWGHWAEWVGQTQDYAPRFDLLNPGWYWLNLTHEWQRYGPGLAEGWFRPGLWAMLVGLPLSFFLLIGRPKQWFLLLPAGLMPLLFALFIYLKLANYLVNVWPLLMLVVAAGVVRLWQQSSRWRPLLLLVGLLVVAEGGWRWANLLQASQQVTAYATFIGQVRQFVPAGATVLGLHHYWFELDDHDYRSWALPLLQSGSYGRGDLTLEQALDQMAPGVILLDPRMGAYFAAEPIIADRVNLWMSGRGFTLTGIVNDPTYGRMEIWTK